MTLTELGQSPEALRGYLAPKTHFSLVPGALQAEGVQEAQCDLGSRVAANLHTCQLNAPRWDTARREPTWFQIFSRVRAETDWFLRGSHGPEQSEKNAVLMEPLFINTFSPESILNMFIGVESSYCQTMENLLVSWIPADRAGGWAVQAQAQPFAYSGWGGALVLELDSCLSLPPSTRGHAEALAAPRRCEVRGKEGMK